VEREDVKTEDTLGKESLEQSRRKECERDDVVEEPKEGVVCG
jgi:hypothetical protein